MKGKYLACWLALIVSLGGFSAAQAQPSKAERNGRATGVISELEKLRDKATADIKRYDEGIRKCDVRIGKAEGVVALAQQKGNAPAETIAREAAAKGREARALNVTSKGLAERFRNKVENAIASVRAGGKYPEATLEQIEFEDMNADWMMKQNELIDARLKEPNKYAGAITRSLKTNAPPSLTPKGYDEMQPGDVLLLDAEGGKNSITRIDNRLTVGGNASITSHTVIYLKTVNGRKFFMDNQRGEGPRVISEELFLERYGGRGADVAKLPARLAQPLREDDGKKLFEAAVEMAQKNNQDVARNNKKFWIDTRYGVWGKDDVVCSEADWALINNVGKGRGLAIPESSDLAKLKMGVSFSPADYRNSPYFFVTPGFNIP